MGTTRQRAERNTPAPRGERHRVEREPGKPKPKIQKRRPADGAVRYATAVERLPPPRQTSRLSILPTPKRLEKRLTPTKKPPNLSRGVDCVRACYAS